MSKLIVNAATSETRIALLEDDAMAELYIERSDDRGLVGNVYLGTVSRVLPGMQAAFVNIGVDRTAFLYGGDVLDPSAVDDNPHLQSRENEGELPEQDRKPIEEQLKEGQRVVVQVVKEPLGSKGARVTMFLSIPGRQLVLMPDFRHIGVSRRIEDEDERERLTKLVDELKPPEFGIIIRTAALGVDRSEIKKDLDFLVRVWRDVKKRLASVTPPQLLYRDLDLVPKTVRDLYSEDIDKIVVDTEPVYKSLKKFLSAVIPDAVTKLELYSDPTPIFDLYGIEVDIGRALSSRVELPSGGYLVVDQTEALTSFDVNTGRFVGQLSAKETILQTNLEAATQVVAQLRVRNIGGIIVIDFIDMEDESDREEVFERLQAALKQDKAKNNVLRISELGLVQMTRKRTTESLERQLTEPCPLCDGRGRVKSVTTEAYDLLREIQRHYMQTGAKKIIVRARTDIRDWIFENESELYESITRNGKIKVDFKPAALTLDKLSEAAFEIVTRKS